MAPNKPGATIDTATPRPPMPMAPSGPCWVCAGVDRTRVWSDPFDLSDHPRFGPYAHADNPDSWLVRCRRCGFAQPESVPATDDYFERLYADQPWLTEASMRGDYERGSKDYVFDQILADVNTRLDPGVPRTLLDVGTYTGRFLERAGSAGFETEGVELNVRAADFAARRTGRTVHRVKAEDLAAEGRRYGVVSLVDVLEHITRPAPLLARLRDLLVPGGILAVKVPHGPVQRLKERLRGLRHRGQPARRAANIGVMTRFVHVSHFTVGSLHKVLTDAGYAPVLVLTAAPEFKQATPDRTQAEHFRAGFRVAAYRASRLIPGGVYSPISFNLQAYAVNPPPP